MISSAPADDLLLLTASLVAVPSVSGGKSSPTSSSGACGERPAWPNRVGNNVVIARTGAGRERRVVLGGHLDTVPANGNEVPRLDGDVLHGLGSADMKGGLAVLLRLAEEISAGREPRFDVHAGVLRGRGDRRRVQRAPPRVRRAAGPAARRRLRRAARAHRRARRGGLPGHLHLRAHFEGERAHSARPVDGQQRHPRRRRRSRSSGRPRGPRRWWSTASSIASRSRSCASRVASPTTSFPTSARSS